VVVLSVVEHQLQVVPESLAPPIPDAPVGLGRGTRWIPVGVGLSLALFVGPQLVDDAYISMRYAANIASGHGPVFNVGAKVEGISNPFWTWLLSGASALGLPLPQVAVVLGVLAFLGVVVVSMALARRAGARPVTAVVAGLLVAMCAPLVGASLNGLETALFALAVTTAVLVLVATDLPTVSFSAALLVVALTRPEGPAIAFLVLLVGVAARRATGMSTKGFRLSALVLGGGVATLLVFRYLYYGQLLPMSAIAKGDRDVDAVSAFLRGAHWGASYLVESLSPVWLIIICAALVLLAVRWRPRLPQTRVTVTVTTAVVCAGCLVVLFNHGDWMPHARLIAPYLPVLLVVLAVGLDNVVPRPQLLLAVLIIGIALQPWGQLFEDRWQPIHNGYDDLATALARGMRPTDRITTNVLGHLGYSGSSLSLFDLHGLTEPSIAQLPRQADSFGKEAADIAGKHNNAVVLVNRWQLVMSVTSGSNRHYVALVSDRLTRDNAFIAVRDDQATRIAALLAPRFRPRITTLKSAVTTWSQAAPRGTVPGAGP
jgi:hypothetical protein